MHKLVPVTRHGTYLNHNETLVPRIRHGLRRPNDSETPIARLTIAANPNETLMPAVRCGLPVNHNEALVMASGITTNDNETMVRAGA